MKDAAIQSTLGVGAAAADRAGRREFDAYYTPNPLVTALLDRHPWLLQCGTILEPCAGEGNISDALKARGADVITGDIRPEVGADYTWDFTLEGLATYADPEPPMMPKVGAIITNPPFSESSAFVRAALAITPNVAMLMRMTWIEPTKDRREIWRDTPPSWVHVLNPRPCFTGDGKSDSATCAWFVWQQQPCPDAPETFLEPMTDWHHADQGVLL